MRLIGSPNLRRSRSLGSAHFDRENRALSEGVGGVAGSISALKQKVGSGSSAVVVTIGDSTADASNEWVYAFADWLGTQGAQTYTHRFYNDAGSSWPAATTLKSGTGNTVDFWSASISGTKPTYLLGAKRTASIDGMPGTVDLVIINHGLNVVGYTNDYTRRAQLMMLLEACKLKWPTAPVLIVNENPQRDDSNMAVVNTAWKSVEALYPDCSVLNVYDAFIAAGKPAGYYDDNLHPSVAATTPGKGQAVILDLMKALYGAAGTVPITPAAANLSIAGTNLLSNGDFASFASSPPTSWATGGGATVTKDVGVVDPLYGTYSARVEGTSANGYIQQQVGAPALAACVAAGFCTLAVRVYIPAGSANTVGRVGIICGPAFVTSAIEVNVVAEGGWQWLIVPNLPVPSDADSLYVRLFCDTAANASSKAYYSRAILVAGSLPRNM